MHEPTNPTVDVVLLTAGASTRLGTPKQHTLLGSKSLLVRSLEHVFELRDVLHTSRKPIVVSGAYLQQDCVAMAHLGVQASINHHYNARWQEGMQSSLACVRESATAKGILVLLVDQYRLVVDDVVRLVNAWAERPERPAAARFAGTIGPPVIWPQSLWSAQTAEKEPLNKSTLRAGNPTLIDTPNAAFDLDTNTDLEQALSFAATVKSD